MKHAVGLRRAFVAVATLATALLVLAHAEAAKPKSKPKPAAAGRPCYDCHKDAKQEYLSKKFVHAPVAKSDCAVCHQRHGFSNKLILTKEVPALCFGCHDAVRTAAKAAHPTARSSRGSAWAVTIPTPAIRRISSATGADRLVLRLSQGRRGGGQEAARSRGLRQGRLLLVP